ncbi:hypothetical protein EWM64_g6058 [Hericium alpestre]|uniref:Uncharacterized protein n=1 Tax=Hericium alpestre TaxID=135208 RepID=A0A4Y9ZV87_9AGAM|nr:hypothetical protein EWM64_g6058 [Hericium alpestre]
MPVIAPIAYFESTLSLMRPAPIYDNTFFNPATIPPAMIHSSGTFMAPIELPFNALGVFQGALDSAAPSFPRPLPAHSPAFYPGYNPHVALTVEPVFSPPHHATRGHSAPLQAAPVAVQTSTDKNTPGGFPCEACFQILSRRDAVTRHYPVCPKYEEWLISLILSGPTFASYSSSGSSAGSTPPTSDLNSPASEVAELVPSPSPFTPDQLDAIVRILQQSSSSTPLSMGPSGATVGYAQPALASLPPLLPLTPAGKQLLRGILMDLAAPIGNLYIPRRFRGEDAHLNDVPFMIAGLWILASTPGFENCDAVPKGAGIIAERLNLKTGKKLGIPASQRSKILGHAELIYHRAQEHWLLLRAST